MLYPILVHSRDTENQIIIFKTEIYINAIPRVGEFIDLGKLDGIHKVTQVIYTPSPYGDTRIELICIRGN